jgi:hypothetical protein
VGSCRRHTECPKVRQIGFRPPQFVSRGVHLGPAHRDDLVVDAKVAGRGARCGVVGALVSSLLQLGERVIEALRHPFAVLLQPRDLLAPELHVEGLRGGVHVGVSLPEVGCELRMGSRHDEAVVDRSRPTL